VLLRLQQREIEMEAQHSLLQQAQLQATLAMLSQKSLRLDLALSELDKEDVKPVDQRHQENFETLHRQKDQLNIGISELRLTNCTLEIDIALFKQVCSITTNKY
jgi:hypothetical protein